MTKSRGCIDQASKPEDILKHNWNVRHTPEQKSILLQDQLELLDHTQKNSDKTINTRQKAQRK